MAILFKNYYNENENIGLFKKFMENGLVSNDWSKQASKRTPLKRHEETEK